MDAGARLECSLYLAAARVAAWTRGSGWVRGGTGSKRRTLTEGSLMKFRTLFATSVLWLLGLLLVNTRAGHAAVIWKGDFETGDLKQFMGGINQTKGARVNAEVVTSPAQQGKSAGRLTIHAD